MLLRSAGRLPRARHRKRKQDAHSRYKKEKRELRKEIAREQIVIKHPAVTPKAPTTDPATPKSRCFPSCSPASLLIPLAPHAPRLAATTLLSSDPFSDPVFTGAAQASLHWNPAMTGIACYAVGMCMLTWWDEKVLPKLQRDGVLPYHSEEARMIDMQKRRREAAAAARPLTPLTAARQPLASELDQRACHYIGTVDNVRQYVCVRHDDAIGDECELSDEFSEQYGVQVVICKKAEAGAEDFLP